MLLPVRSRLFARLLARTAVLLLLVPGLGCTLLGIKPGASAANGSTTTATAATEETPEEEQAPPGELPPEYRVEEEDDTSSPEAGVRTLRRLMRAFAKAVNKKHFDAAKQLLNRAQRRISKASDLTLSHPDIDDVQRTVAAGRGHLDEAIEKDRIERRNKAIDDLMRRAKNTLEEANLIFAELNNRFPSSGDVGRLDDAMKELLDIKNGGAQYLDEPRYKTHASERDKLIEAVAEKRDVTRWRLESSEQLKGPVKDGYAAVKKARAAKGLEDQLEEYSAAVNAFAICGQVVAKLQKQPLFAPDRVVKTKFGELTVGATYKKCSEVHSQASGRVSELTWQIGVRKMLSEVDPAIQQMKKAKGAQAELDTARAAADALSVCERHLDDVTMQEGYQSKVEFSSGLGKLNGAKLLAACKAERQRLVKSLPTLEWRTTLEPLRKHILDAKQLTDDAHASKTATAAVPIWEKVIVRLTECIDEAGARASTQGADRALKIDSEFGKHPITKLQSLCQERKAAAGKALATATKKRELEQFADNCEGDEKTTVMREGLPSRVQKYSDGRVFFYDGKRSRKFGFDAKGVRTDFWAKWRDLIAQLVGELTRINEAVNEAKTASARIKAIEEAKPVLDVCGEIVTTSEKGAGYDPRAKFKTPFGTLTAPQITDTCAKAQTKLQASLEGLRWVAQVEDLRDRLHEAKKELADAGKMKPGPRAELLGGVVGSMEECQEQAAALPNMSGAQRSFKLTTDLGRLSLSGFRSVCRKLGDQAKKEADKAIAEKKLEEFLATCKGDEKAVAKREGLPTRVEDLGKGRVFVYEKGKRRKAKRFAFDGDGKRVDERVLKSGAKSK